MTGMRLAVSEGDFHVCPWCQVRYTILGLVRHLAVKCADRRLQTACQAALDEWDEPGWPWGYTVARILDEYKRPALATALRERADLRTGARS